MTSSRTAGRVGVALMLVGLWAGGDLATVALAKRGLEPGVGGIGRVGRIGDPGGIRTIDNRVRNRGGRLWDEIEDEQDENTVKTLLGKNELPQGVDGAQLAAWFYVANVLLNLDETITKG